MKRKLLSMVIPFILLTAAMMAISIYGSRRQSGQDFRSRATNQVSCDYEFTISLPQPTAGPTGADTGPSACRDADLAIIISRSESMAATQDGKTRLDWAKESAKSLVTAVKNSNTSTVRFSILSTKSGDDKDGENDGVVHIRASTDYDGVLRAIDAVETAQSGVCGQCGIRQGTNMVKAGNGTKAVIFVSDGIMGQSSNEKTNDGKTGALARAQNGQKQGVMYYVIGYGSPGAVDEATLEAIAGPSGIYKYRPQAPGWQQTFLEFLPIICPSR